MSSTGTPSLLRFLCQQKVVTLDPGEGLIVDVMGVCEPKSPDNKRCKKGPKMGKKLEGVPQAEKQLVVT